jgi:GAF domain-containing protein
MNTQGNRQAVPEWSVEIQHRRAAILNYLLLAAVIGGVVAMLLQYATFPEGVGAAERLAIMAPFVAGWLIVLVVWRWRGLDYSVRSVTLLALAFGLGVIVFARGGLAGSGRIWLLLPPILAFVLAGPRVGALTGAISVLMYGVFAIAIDQKWIVPQVAEDLTALAPLLGEGGSYVLAVLLLTVILWTFDRGWEDALFGMDTAHRQLQAQTQELEQANEQLRWQASQLRTTAEIAQAGSSILDLEALLGEVVRRIQAGFELLGVYYVGVFILDETQHTAVLRAAAGEAGRLLLEMGHKLRVDETSAVGRCIVQREATTALEGGEETVWSEHALLSLTRSEIALPLYSRGRVLGALSLQSTREEAFGEADVTALQMMASQVAVAIDNATLFSRTEAALEEVQAVHRRYLARAWEEFLAARPVARVDYSRFGVRSAHTGPLSQARRDAAVSGRAVVTEGVAADEGPDIESQPALVVPVKLRGQVIGTMALQGGRQRQSWGTEEIAVAEAVAEQVALTVENLRLMDESQRRAARQELIREVADKMSRAPDIDTLMQIALRETATALGVSDAFVQLGVPTDSSEKGKRETRILGEQAAAPRVGGHEHAEPVFTEESDSEGGQWEEEDA